MKLHKPEVVAVVGGQWGDEGKGKIVDYLATDSDVIIRAQGGDNAGHTVANEKGEFALHLVPAGIFNPDSINIIGAGTALNIQTLLRELKELAGRGISIKNLLISPKAHLAFDYHLYLDRVQESARGVRKIETTKRGIGPTYMDKAERAGLQARLLRDPKLCLEQLAKVLKEKKKHFPVAKIPEFQASYYEKLIYEAAAAFKDMVIDTEPIIEKYLNKGKKFLIEGAHGALLDLDHGTYPMVTASNSTVGGLLVGAGMPPIRLSKVVGIFKAYQTRVGAGAMPTELHNKLGTVIRDRGHEFGTTTGRPRRIGYFDGVAAAYSHQINGYTDLALTRLDTLTDVGDLKICRAYKYLGKTQQQFFVDNERLEKCQAIYSPEDEFASWQGDLSQAKSLADLPMEARNYAKAAASTMPGARLSFIGVGPSRNDLIAL